MKRLTRTIFLSLIAISLSSCDILGGLTGQKNYSGYEDYFTKECKYTKYTDVNALNAAIGDSSYFWSMNDSTDYTAYYSGKSILAMVYKNEAKIYVDFTDGNGINLKTKDGVTSISTDNDFVIYNAATEQTKVNITGHEDDLKVAKDNSGYLVVAYQKYMFYVPNDLKSIYVNEKNTNVFQGYSDTKTIPSSELLTTTLAAFGADQRVKLPAPSANYEIWYGMDYYKEEKSHGTAYIADVHPKDYVKVLEQNGFTVIRSWEDPFYAFYTNDGGYWYCYDQKEEIELIISLQNYLYTNNTGKTYGPFYNTNIWFYRMRKGYIHGKGQTKNDDWSDYDKQNMAGWYDGTIDATCVPFIKLGNGYSVPSASLMSYAHNGLLDGTLKLHSKCYNIYDNSPHYYLDGYDQILEANGFHKYVYNFDLNNYEQRQAFLNTEECKYAECFINEEKDIAIKYYFDTTNGNTIRVFKKSEMKSWLQDEK